MSVTATRTDTHLVIVESHDVPTTTVLDDGTEVTVWSDVTTIESTPLASFPEWKWPSPISLEGEHALSVELYGERNIAALAGESTP